MNEEFTPVEFTPEERKESEDAMIWLLHAQTRTDSEMFESARQQARQQAIQKGTSKNPHFKRRFSDSSGF